MLYFKIFAHIAIGIEKQRERDRERVQESA